MSHLPAPYAPASWPAYGWTPPPYRTGGLHLAVAWFGAVITVGYLLPWAIAATRDRRDTAFVAVVNLLLGWTIVGWIVAVILACRSDPPPAVVLLPVPYAAYQAQPIPAAPAPWSGSEPTVVLPRTQPEPTLILPPGEPPYGR